MKKTYSKPEILFDDFTLSTNIAAGCALETDTPQWDACGVQWGEYMIFVSKMSGCLVNEIHGKAILDSTSYCYHVPTDTTKLFNSL